MKFVSKYLSHILQFNIVTIDKNEDVALAPSISKILASVISWPKNKISLNQSQLDITDTIIFCDSKFHQHEYNYWGEKTKSNSNLFRYILLGFFNRSSALLRSIFLFYAIILYAFSGGKPLLLNNINDKFDVSFNNI